MRILLDTHIIIWAVSEPTRLSSKARDLIQNADQIFVSSASIWEMAIKSGLGKLEVDLDRFTSELAKLGIIELAVSWQHAKSVKTLPLYHRDPFDRLLVSQAMSEPLILLTHDKVLSQYSDLVKLV